MKIVYIPEGTDKESAKRWPWEPGKLPVPEVIEVEQATRWTYEEWVDHVERGSMGALRAFLWIMLKREDSTLKINQVVFSMSEVGLDLDDDEKRFQITRLEMRLRDEALTNEEVANIEGTIAAIRADLPPEDDDAEPAVVRGEVATTTKRSGPKGRSSSE